MEDMQLVQDPLVFISIENDEVVISVAEDINNEEAIALLEEAINALKKDQ